MLYASGLIHSRISIKLDHCESMTWETSTLPLFFSALGPTVLVRHDQTLDEIFFLVIRSPQGE